MKCAWTVGLASLAIAFGMGPVAQAADRLAAPPVELLVDPCVPLESPVILSMLELELTGAVLQPSGTAATATRVHVNCPDGATVQIEVGDPLTGKSVIRSLSLRGVQSNAQARLLALAIAELVTASWMELEASPRRSEAQPTASRSTPDVLAGARAVVRSRLEMPEDDVQVAAILTGRLVGQTISLMGAGLRLSRQRDSRLGFAVDTIFERGQQSFAFGRIDLNALSGSALLQYRRSKENVSVGVGAGLRAGVVWIHGEDSGSPTVDQSSFAAPWGGPILNATAALRLFRHLGSALSFEAGYALVSARGRVVDNLQANPDAGAAGLTGVWLGLSLSIGYGT